jgi:hypothetical protein
MMLNGFNNFYNELKLDTTSFLHDYYKKNKYLLTDEEDDEEVDNDERQSEIIPLHKDRSTKTIQLSEETKSTSSNGPIKITNINNKNNNNNGSNSNNVSEIKTKGKKPILPANATEAHKSYYEIVEKVIYSLLKMYELNETNG